MKLLRGVQNVRQARQEAARVERAVGSGQDPFPGPAMNPVKMVPPSRRPALSIDRDQPWLEDEAKVPELVEALGSGSRAG